MSDVRPPDGVICSIAEYTRSLNDSSIYCLTRAQSIGLTITAEAGLISLSSVLLVFVIIFRNAFRHLRDTPSRKWQLVEEPMDVLMLSLFVADLIQALGAVLDIKWVHTGKVEVGSFCTAQGVVQQLGETGVAITTLMIAIFTFIGVWWRKGMGATRTAKIVIGFVWLFVVLMVAVGNGAHPGEARLYESPTPYWCWIGQSYLELRIWGEYIWFWITLCFSLVAYVSLYFWSRGNITVSEETWWKFSIHKADSEGLETPRRSSLAMLAYPIVYSILILPLSVVRWIGFVQERGGRQSHIASGATFTVISIYGLSGAMNVLLLLTTRPNSLLFGHSRAASDDDDAEGRAPSPVPSLKLTSGRGSVMTAEDLQLGRLPSRASEEDGERWELRSEFPSVRSESSRVSQRHLDSV